jgi:hypothetical protein
MSSVYKIYIITLLINITTLFPTLTYGSLTTFNAILALDAPDLKGATYNSFRTTKDPYLLERLQQLQGGEIKIFNPRLLENQTPWKQLSSQDKTGISYTRIPSREGLDNLNASGSSQFGASGFAAIIDRIRAIGHTDGIVVIDHREEPHAFINEGIPVSLYARSDAFNIGRNWAQLEDVETLFIKTIDTHQEVWLNEIIQKIENRVAMTRQHPEQVNIVYNEKYLVKDIHYCGYARIGITDHHRAMDDDLDDIKKHFDALPAQSWKHFHCRGGKGRTTSGMILFDILANYHNPQLTFEDIVLRHWLIGGSNLLQMPSEDPDKRWKAQAAYDRIKVLYKFYTDVRAHHPRTRWFYAQHEETFQGSDYIPQELSATLKPVYFKQRK